MELRGRLIRLGALLLAVSLLSLWSMTVGAGHYGFGDVFGALSSNATDHTVLIDLRLPRVLLCLWLGAALGTAGALTQGLFQNPLAAPGVLGVQAGAAAAVILGMALGLDTALWATPLTASIGAAVILVLLFALAAGRGTATLLLTGVALTAVAGALTTLVLAQSVESDSLARRAALWMMGSFSGRGWQHLRWSAIPVSVGLVAAMVPARALDALGLGDDTAQSLGIDTSKVRWLVAAAVGLLVGTATAMVGTIAFVGLLVPHLARRLVGSNHRLSIPGSALAGGGLVLAVDSVGRALSDTQGWLNASVHAVMGGTGPVYLPPGALTSLLGGIFFLVLLRRAVEQRTEAA